MDTIGIIAGSGQFPVLVARAAKAQGRKVVAVAHEGEASPELAEVADEITWVRLGQLGKLIKSLHKGGARAAVMCGAINKASVFKGVRFDMKALSLLSKLKQMSDDGILRTVCGVLENEGIAILPAHSLIPELLAAKGVYTRRRPSKDELADIEIGWKVAGELGRLDVGQCVVVRARVVVALEALEGTDACIRRAGELANAGLVVVKRCKPIQDERFDLPAVGLGTLQTMRQAGAGCLAIEAGRTLVFDRQALKEQADQAGICILARDLDK